MLVPLEHEKPPQGLFSVPRTGRHLDSGLRSAPADKIKTAKEIYILYIFPIWKAYVFHIEHICEILRGLIGHRAPHHDPTQAARGDADRTSPACG